jgi:hypothetical protein
LMIMSNNNTNSSSKMKIEECHSHNLNLAAILHQKDILNSTSLRRIRYNNSNNLNLKVSLPQQHPRRISQDIAPVQPLRTHFWPSISRNKLNHFPICKSVLLALLLKSLRKKTKVEYWRRFHRILWTLRISKLLKTIPK